MDTNVFLHADNQQEQRQADAQKLIGDLQHCHTHLCIDEGFSLNEAENRSQIGGEYLKHLKPGMLGFALVAFLAQSARVKLVPRSVPQNVSKVIRNRVHDRADHVFVRVAYNSIERTLASHDFANLPTDIRALLQNEIEVRVVSALECSGCLA